jgi:hypothetical protein
MITSVPTLAPMADADWGSVPDWLAAIGALVALIFAGIGARAVLRANEQQSKQLAGLDADVRRLRDNVLGRGWRMRCDSGSGARAARRRPTRRR